MARKNISRREEEEIELTQMSPPNSPKNVSVDNPIEQKPKRTILIGQKNPFCKNFICNQKYNIFSFTPRVFYEQVVS